MYALVDCNNFYASCERVFNPQLEKKPIIVLSNNDGCAIARSEEAKALGVQMGTPEFMIRELIKEKDIHVFSSNYALYGDLSDRVMTILLSFAPAVEVYSIDEAFLDLGQLSYQNLEILCQTIRQTVRQHTGIPVSIGIAPTKTLAKMANRYAKKNKKDIGLHWLKTNEDIQQVLDYTEVGDIWGIGSQRAGFLTKRGISTAGQLAKASDEWIRKELTVTGLRLLNELRGNPCIEWELEAPAKKNICTSRSFGKLLTEKTDIAQAIANYTASCSEKLRRQGSCARKLHIFLQTNPHRTGDKQYFRSFTMVLPVPTNSAGELAQFASKMLDHIFRVGFNYMKCGVMVLDLIPESQVQGAIFDERNRKRERMLMRAIDLINQDKGKDIVRLASQGFDSNYKLRYSHLSPRYTTRLPEIVKVR